MPQHRQVVDHQRHQPPVQAKNNADLPQRAHRRARQPRCQNVNTLIAVRQHLAQPGRQRPDNEESQRHGHAQTDQRREEVFHRGRQQPGALFFQPAADPRGENNRDHRRAVVEPRDGDAQKGFRYRPRLLAGVKCRNHHRMGERPADHHGNKRVAAELFPGGIAQHQREEEKQRIAGGKPDFIRAALGREPAADHGQRQQPLQNTGRGQNADKRGKDPGDDVNEAAQQVPLFALLFHDRGIVGQACFIAHCLPDVVNVVANHHLKLAAAFDHHDHARVFLEPFRIRLLILFQFEAKPGRTVHKTDDVLFSANVAENILR